MLMFNLVNAMQTFINNNNNIYILIIYYNILLQSFASPLEHLTFLFGYGIIIV